jgi:hypothetical protein
MEDMKDETALAAAGQMVEVVIEDFYQILIKKNIEAQVVPDVLDNFKVRIAKPIAMQFLCPDTSKNLE